MKPTQRGRSISRDNGLGMTFEKFCLYSFFLTFFGRLSSRASETVS